MSGLKMWHVQFKKCDNPELSFFSVRGMESDADRTSPSGYDFHIPYEPISVYDAEQPSISSLSTELNAFSLTRVEDSANPIHVLSEKETNSGYNDEVLYSTQASLLSKHASNGGFSFPLRFRTNYGEVSTTPIDQLASKHVTDSGVTYQLSFRTNNGEVSTPTTEQLTPKYVNDGEFNYPLRFRTNSRDVPIPSTTEQLTPKYVIHDDSTHPQKLPANYGESGFKRLANGGDDVETSSNDDRLDNGDWNVILYGNHWQIFWAVAVRTLLMAHNVLTVWRVVEAYDNPLYWMIALCNVILVVELMVVVVKRAGVDDSWWTPSFLIYLLATIPAIWLLQLELYVDFITQNGYDVIVSNVTDTASYLNNVSCKTEDDDRVIRLDNSLWIIIIQESLVYLLVFSRWLLPRGRVTRAFLADLLLEFLAIASDIMELLVVFEEDEIRGNLKLTYVILAVWSASFVQFIPVLMHKRRFRHVRNLRIEFVTRMCGDKFVEIVVTCMSIFLQDLPFLIVRLYVIFKVQLISYSLIFFVLKNAVTLMLLFYRLFVVIRHLPICKRTVSEKDPV